MNPALARKARFNMIEQQVRTWNVLDTNVLELLSAIDRQDFVPTGYKDLAYADMEIPLGDGQTMLPPRVQARMLQDLAVKKHEKVLQVGAGSGFMTALLAHNAQRVLALEIRPALADMARANLQKAGVTNAEVRCADASRGAAADGPFDAIVLCGSVADVPQLLLEQLKLGGRMCAIVGDEPVMRATLISRNGASQFRTLHPWDCNAPRLENFAQASRFTF
jgi:protein-L-isoaspartate(D-aspartate) O-methyltransferase